MGAQGQDRASLPQALASERQQIKVFARFFLLLGCVLLYVVRAFCCGVSLHVYPFRQIMRRNFLKQGRL